MSRPIETVTALAITVGLSLAASTPAALFGATADEEAEAVEATAEAGEAEVGAEVAYSAVGAGVVEVAVEAAEVMVAT